MKVYCFFILLFVWYGGYTQTIKEKLTVAMQQLAADTQLQHATIGFSVVDSKTGKTVYEYNAQIGLAPASTQKLFTSVAAFDILGNTYKYKTELGYSGMVENNKLKGNLIIKGYGDPTLGAARFKKNNTPFTEELFERIRLFPIDTISGYVYADESAFEFQTIPNGWLWEDIGNYYAAGCSAINWNENVYPLSLQTGSKIGETPTIIIAPASPIVVLNNITTAAANSGDNAYIHLPPNAAIGSVEGTIPANQKVFTISGAVPNATTAFLQQLKNYFNHYGIKVNKALFKSHYDIKLQGDSLPYNFIKIYTHYSPPLDSINYWFLKKSINLYGEALIKTIAYEKTGFGTTEKGVALVKDFWGQHGIEKTAINIIDGSGLSPQNHVTTTALVQVLQYAKTRPWYTSFYNALPDYNGMKMKSGSIAGVKAFAGYHTTKQGNSYTYAIIINNFNGANTDMLKKIYKLLDNLK